jgi:hypothetical protein
LIIAFFHQATTNDIDLSLRHSNDISETAAQKRLSNVAARCYDTATFRQHGATFQIGVSTKRIPDGIHGRSEKEERNEKATFDFGLFGDIRICRVFFRVHGPTENCQGLHRRMARRQGQQSSKRHH